MTYKDIVSNTIDGTKEIETEEEINNIVYSIFNVKLAENISIKGLKYQNGQYYFEKNDTKKIGLDNIERDTAARSIFILFEIDGISYIAKIATNTVTGENYIQSIIKE
ncbi:MAG: hypothetical protein IJ890_02755 [Clostridia bacterium]|nr:hypothetical protein [Clostridia bacterium]